MRRMLLAATLALLVLLPGCRTRHRADEALCVEILNRIIDLELEAMGYHDPALVNLKRRQLRETLKPTLSQCVGMTAPKHALSCVQGASTMAELTHECLSIH